MNNRRVQNSRGKDWRRHQHRQHNTRWLQIITQGNSYNPYRGYIDYDYDYISHKMVVTGKYIHDNSHSRAQKWLKRYSSKRTRKYPMSNGNYYRKKTEYWYILF